MFCFVIVVVLREAVATTKETIVVEDGVRGEGQEQTRTVSGRGVVGCKRRVSDRAFRLPRG